MCLLIDKRATAAFRRRKSTTPIRAWKTLTSLARAPLNASYEYKPGRNVPKRVKCSDSTSMTIHGNALHVWRERPPTYLTYARVLVPVYVRPQDVIALGDYPWGIFQPPRHFAVKALTIRKADWEAAFGKIRARSKAPGRR